MSEIPTSELMICPECNHHFNAYDPLPADVEIDRKKIPRCNRCGHDQQVCDRLDAKDAAYRAEHGHDLGGFPIEPSYVESLRLPPEQHDALTKGEWKPADAAQAEGRLLREAIPQMVKACGADPPGWCPQHGYSDLEGNERCPDCALEECKYLEAYRETARLFNMDLASMGWAHAKGKYKRMISNMIHNYHPSVCGLNGPQNAAHIDAVLGSMGC